MELNDVVQQLRDPVVDSMFAREFQASTAFKPLPPAFLDRAVGESMTVPARVWRDALSGVLAGGSTGELRRIQAPTPLIWGEHDGLFDRAQQNELVRRIRSARLVAYPEIGHAPYWEDRRASSPISRPSSTSPPRRPEPPAQ